MLKYSLLENQLTDRPDDYSAQTHIVASIDKESIITRMLSRGTLLTRTDIVAVLNNLEETIVDAILEGNSINFPLFNTSFSISGVFEGALDSFDGNRHKLNINLTKGLLLREAEKRVKLEKTNAVTPLPQIQEIKDSISGTFNERLTPKGVIEIRGYNLKIAGNDPSCGLWFVPELGDEVKADVFISNKPSNVIAMIPPLSNGRYKVKIVTQYLGSSILLKIPKTYTYSKPLIVEN